MYLILRKQFPPPSLSTSPVQLRRCLGYLATAPTLKWSPLATESIEFTSVRYRVSWWKWNKGKCPHAFWSVVQCIYHWTLRTTRLPGPTTPPSLVLDVSQDHFITWNTGHTCNLQLYPITIPSTHPCVNLQGSLEMAACPASTLFVCF